jgi:hypothetical protein
MFLLWTFNAEIDVVSCLIYELTLVLEYSLRTTFLRTLQFLVALIVRAKLLQC